MGLVICKPFGFEAMSAHLSVRAFAEAAAELGIPALRFDHVGTGDSEDLVPGADQFEAWTQDVIAAVQELQRRTESSAYACSEFGSALCWLPSPRRVFRKYAH
jgi:alpha-beta hydrolase superfamily lysophospholipase